MKRSYIEQKETKNITVHFMGIGGSGMSAVALLAQHAGFRVSGCDLQESNGKSTTTALASLVLPGEYNVSS